jgi:predicted transcriptional regulator
MATLSIRIPEEIGEQLEKLAESIGLTRSFLALDALRRYLAQEEWQARALRTAVERADRGTAKYASHDAVDHWLAGVLMRKEMRQNANKMAGRRHQ